jgi:hypothetical protein
MSGGFGIGCGRDRDAAGRGRGGGEGAEDGTQKEGRSRERRLRRAYRPQYRRFSSPSPFDSAASGSGTDVEGGESSTPLPAFPQPPRALRQLLPASCFRDSVPCMRALEGRWRVGGRWNRLSPSADDNDESSFSRRVFGRAHKSLDSTEYAHAHGMQAGGRCVCESRRSNCARSR